MPPSLCLEISDLVATVRLLCTALHIYCSEMHCTNMLCTELLYRALLHWLCPSLHSTTQHCAVLNCPGLVITQDTRYMIKYYLKQFGSLQK